MADIDGYLKQIRSAEAGETVRDAIINCLRDINRDVPVQEEDWEGYMPESTDLTLSGHYKSVHVMHNPSSGKSTTLKTLHVTENDTYEPENDNEYFNKVIVEVDQSPYTIKEDAVEITQNGTYYAKSDWGVNGVAQINVNVTEVSGEGPFTVEFYSYDKTTVIATETVPKNGKASCTIYDGTSRNGQYFTGWNPSPSNVTRDMKCYPMYGDVVIDPGEIQDSWETICAKCGAGYALGAYKALVVSVPVRPQRDAYEWNTNNEGIYYSGTDVTHAAINIAMHMVKVAEGEDGTTSTWLSTGVIPVFPTWDSGQGGLGKTSTDMKSAICGRSHKPKGDGTVRGDIHVDWVDSPRREYLNEYLIENIPECIGATIKPVNKTSATLNNVPYYNGNPATSGTRIYKPSIDKIWVPSLKELYTYISSKGYSEDYLVNVEPTGIDYSLVYMPTYPGKSILTRTCVKHNLGWGFGNLILSAEGTAIQMNYDSSPGTPIGFCL